MSNKHTAVFALEDGSVFRGKAFGAIGKKVLGEAVFNTSMTGYQEILTDPSYLGQIITMTAPQIGNYGVNRKDVESNRPMAGGFVVRELSPISSNWRSEDGLSEYLGEHGVSGIESVDTRAITMKIRNGGNLKSCLVTEDITDVEAVELAREWEGLEGKDLVAEASCKKVYPLDLKEEDCNIFSVEGTEIYGKIADRKRFHIVAVDYGAKRSIFKELIRHGFRVTVVPAKATSAEIRELNPDGIFLSNGPGDPGAVLYAHQTVRELIPLYPIFGICMGHQIITHALGAKTYKLKFGHRGGNQPVKNIETGRVSITAQNHGYAARKEELEAVGAIVTEINLNDGTVAGLRHREYPVFSVQYHPEAGPGPNDGKKLFEQFWEMIAQTVSV